MNIDKKALGQRIKSIRQDKGLTMEEFGKFFDNASKGVISNWEKGSNIPNNTRLKMIAQFGGISVDELLYGDYQARIKKILLDKPDIDEERIEFFLKFFIDSNNKYPTKEEIFEQYDKLMESVDSTAKKMVAQKLLAYHIRHSEELLFDFLKDSPKDLDHNNVNLALSELSNAATNYETYFDKAIDEVYDEVIKMQEEEK